jgi:hypothetical protein
MKMITLFCGVVYSVCETLFSFVAMLVFIDLGYTVRYWRKNLDELQNYWERRFPGQRSRAIIIGLESNIEYAVRVFVYTQFGDSPESSYFSHRTFRLPPLIPPQYVSLRQPQRDREKRVRLFSDVYMYKLEVEWRGISTTADEEPLEGYMVRRAISFRTSRVRLGQSVGTLSIDSECDDFLRRWIEIQDHY